jgi:transcriptional regulator with XRE-family HTH domain
MSMGLTQRAVGERLGISQPAIAQFEKVTYTPTVDSILAYAQALGVKVKFSIAAG